MGRRAAVTGLILLTAFVGCSEDYPSTLEPAGPAARRIEGLWWLMFWLALAVFVVVVVLLVVAVARARRVDAVPRAHVAWGEPLVVLGGIVAPAVLLTALFVVGLRDMQALSGPPPGTELTIEVIGHDWWWEVNYPDLGIATAQDIHIPVGRPVALELETADVIHSFWVPRLQAKTDMIPGKTTTMWLQADEVGVYRGQCAEFCGLQHANMAFNVIAETPDDFAAWAAHEAEPAADPATDQARAGEQIFMTNTCVGCHTIQGTPAGADVGPDLTHFARRTTIAAGTLSNTPANLRRWLLDPQGVKPGADMPPIDISEDELAALLAYLESLD